MTYVFKQYASIKRTLHVYVDDDATNAQTLKRNTIVRVLSIDDKHARVCDDDVTNDRASYVFTIERDALRFDDRDAKQREYDSHVTTLCNAIQHIVNTHMLNQTHMHNRRCTLTRAIDDCENRVCALRRSRNALKNDTRLTTRILRDALHAFVNATHDTFDDACDVAIMTFDNMRATIDDDV